MNKKNYDINKIILMQKIIRGFLFRIKRLPLIMYKVKNYLIKNKDDINFSKETNEGRINSSLDEKNIIDILKKKYNDKIIIPKSRMWYDILLFDNKYKWIPINIKTTSMNTSDNTANLAMCVYAYTNEILEINGKKTYENGEMSDILYSKLKNKLYNYNYKKDYYFIVFNKNNSSDIIINSLKGLKILTPNINNLPFQVCWNKNKEFTYDIITNKIELFINCIQKPQLSWREKFINNMRNLKL